MSEETGLIEQMARYLVRERGAAVVASDEHWPETAAHYRRMVKEHGDDYASARSLVNDAFRDARAALSAISAAGWAVVPKEASMEMLNAGYCDDLDGAPQSEDGDWETHWGRLSPEDVWPAMLAAAPKVPGQ